MFEMAVVSSDEAKKVTHGTKQKSQPKESHAKPAGRKSKSKNRGSETKQKSVSKSPRGSAVQRNSQSPSTSKVQRKSQSSDKEAPESRKSVSGQRKSKDFVPKERKKSGKKHSQVEAKERRKSSKRKSKKFSTEEQRGSTGHPRKSKKAEETTKGKVMSEEDAALASKQTSLLCNKMFAIKETVDPCYVCTSASSFCKGGFFCENCQQKFEHIVKNGSSVICPLKGKCPYEKKCDFCLSETFYSNGVRASDIQDFHHISKGFPQFSETSEAVPLNDEETAFCKHFNKTLKCVLDWMWEQGDILKLPPNDRETLKIVRFVLIDFRNAIATRRDLGEKTISNYSPKVTEKCLRK